MNVFILSLGAILGSFCQVVSYRTLRKESFIFGRSYCEHCHRTLHSVDLIPVVSYLFLKGRCRYCKERISSSHFIVEIGMAMMTLIMYWIKGISISFMFTLGIVMLLLVISLMDLECMEIQWSIMVILFIICFVYSLYLNQSIWLSLKEAIMVTIPLLILYFCTKSIGEADIELFFIIAYLCDIKGAIFSFYIAVALGVMYGFYLLLIRKKSLKTAIPFCPFISIGFVFSLLFIL